MSYTKQKGQPVNSLERIIVLTALARYAQPQCTVQYFSSLQVRSILKTNQRQYATE
jgi:hypothetical protein